MASILVSALLLSVLWLMYYFDLDGHPITLVDPPGFDNDVHTDAEILQDIATWMAKKGLMKKQLFDGVVYFHPMPLHRVGVSEQKRMRILEKIIDQHACKKLIIATTMWEELGDTNADTIEQWLQSRTAPGRVWHDLKSRGARIEEYYNSPDSAHRIIRLIILQRADQRLTGKELEEVIKQIKQVLEAHDAKCLPRKEIKTWEQRREYQAWRDERTALQGILESRQQ